MEGLDYWRLCDEFTVIQAALLLTETDPADTQEWVLDWEPDKRPSGFDAAFAALTHAISGGRLRATARHRATRQFFQLEDATITERTVREDGSERVERKEPPDWYLTTVTLDDLREWLLGRGIRTGFFFPLETDSADYLNPEDEHYSPKLAAAIRAWEAVSRDPSKVRGRTVKQALAVWLRLNANLYALTKEDGNPNEQGIEDISKIANWDTKGGAPRTPGE